jgi:sortase A
MTPVRATKARSTLRGLSLVLIAAGVLLIADAVLTVTWQEPITALIAKVRQDKLSKDLRALEKAGPTPLELRALQGLQTQDRRMAFLARSLKRRSKSGAAIGRLRIPRIHTSDVIVNGTQPGDLRRGPGAYEETPLPGAPGTSAIAGHRTTYGAPFRHIDKLKPGDPITVEMPYARFTYRVERTKIVVPTDFSVLKRVRYNRLVLSACHPLFSAAKRIIVFARLERTVPS